MQSRVAESTCPLCHQDNGCEVARTGRLDARCWCRDTVIATDVKRQAAAQGQTCICRYCASRLAP